MYNRATTRSKIVKTDRLALIRIMCENVFRFRIKSLLWIKNWLPLEDNAIRQYIPSKPAKYGIKMSTLVDNKTYYTLNMETTQKKVVIQSVINPKT